MGHDDGNLAGWHRDPSGRHELRFWGGDAWTEHVIDEGIPGLDFPTRSGRAPEGTASSAPPPPIPERREEVDAPTAAVGVEPEPEISEPEVDTDIVDLPAAEAEDRDTAAAEAEAVETEAIETEAGETAADADTLVTAASVLTPTRESEPVSEAGPNFVAIPPAPPPTRPAEPGSSRPGGRSLRSRRRANPPVPPVVAEAAAAPVASSVPDPSPMPASIAPEAPIADASLPAESTAVEPESVVAASATVDDVAEPAIEAAGPAEPEPASAPASEPTSESPPTPAAEPIEPVRGVRPIQLVAESPTVASPAGNTAGSNTSAIADPHRAARPPSTTRADGPRVAGISPVPVKRYRPGSPPASPLAGPRALPAPTSPVGTVVTPWYRKASGWLTILAIGAVAALIVVLVTVTSDDGNTERIGGRPPAAAPQGHKVIDGEGFGIAAPTGWSVGTDPGNTFPQLRRTNWGTPLAAVDTQTIAGEALIVVQLHDLAHEPQVDPELFWSDQIKDAATTRSIKAGPPLSVHGFRANEITATDPSGKALVAASIDTGDRTFLVAVTATAPEAAQTEFDRLIQTFDAR